MKVYRMQDAEGNGVFYTALSKARNVVARQRGFSDWWAMEEARYEPGIVPEPDPYRHPGPSDEHGELRRLHDAGLIYNGSDWRFGFKDEAQMLRWFDSEAIRKALAEDGCRVVVLEVDEADVAPGTWQVVFKGSRAQVDKPVPTLSVAA